MCSYSCVDHIDVPGKGDDPDSTQIAKDKTNWWNEARFGMFIHYGVYSVLGGEYIGYNIDGDAIHFQTLGANNSLVDTIRRGGGAGAEWILYEASIPRSEYKSYARQFTAENYDPQKIVDLALKTGMKYIVLTAKHHDGFCLWNSQTTDWNITHTPAGIRWNNDIISPLAQATRRAGLKFGIYFSHARDWMHTGGLGPIPELSRKEYTYFEKEEYMARYTYPMISELLNRYDPDILWWDSPDCNPYNDFARKCKYLVENHNLNILQNDRLSSLVDYKGDFRTPEQAMDESDSFDGDMELCMTMNSSWGYNHFDNGWKPAEYIIWCLLRANKMGGNFLLNIGPRADGSIPEQSTDILEQVGQWMKNSEQGVYGTKKSPFQFNLPYGPTTWRNMNGYDNLYYHVFYWDGSGELWIPGVMNSANEVSVSLLASPHIHLHVESVKGIGLRVSGLPAKAPSDLCTTLEIRFRNKAQLDEGNREINKIIYLDALGARIGNVDLDDWNTKPCINWYHGSLLYKVIITNPGTYKISANLAAYFSGTINFDFGNGLILKGTNHTTPSGHLNFEIQNMGEIYLNSGVYTVKITSNQNDSWLKLREFRLQRN